MSDQSKATPGPWFADDMWVMATAGGEAIKIAKCNAVLGHISFSQRRANELMCAASWEMIAALKANIVGACFVRRGAIHPSGKFCNVCGSNSATHLHCIGCPIDLAEKAIAKAEGKS